MWMAKFSGLQRRGAIYHWRRRIRSDGGAGRRTHVAISLRTPNLARAKLLAAELNEHEAELGGSYNAEDVVVLGQGLIDQEARDGNWDGKLQRQNRQTYALFARFIMEDEKVRITRLDQLKQAHVAAFVDFLRNDIYRYYGKSSNDFDLSIQQLRQQALDKLKAAKAKADKAAAAKKDQPLLTGRQWLPASEE